MRGIALLVSLAVILSGCSVVFVDGPHVVDGKVLCTDEMTLPLIDAGVALAAIATPFILESNRNRQTENPNYVLDFGLWGVGLATAISAVIGISKVKRCRRTAHDAAP